jgi:hypothetical protein
MSSELPEAIHPVTQEQINELQKKLTSDFWTNKHGKYKKLYGYRDSTDQIQFVAAEFEKSTRTFYYSESGWIPATPRNIKPINLFNVTRISEKCKNVFIVNSEKDAMKKIKDWHGLSWCGGNFKTIGYSNWKKLTNIENIIVWTDEKSAKKIKQRLPHAKIITRGKFSECENHSLVFTDILKLAQLDVREPDPYEFYKLYINEFYGDESLEQRNGIFWQYMKNEHHWIKEDMENIKANYQTWFAEHREDIGTSLLDYVRAEGQAINKFINNTIEFIRRHASCRIYSNPFKDSAISPYIHLENGMIYLSKKGKMAEWIDRAEENEDFFRKKYPVHCCDYEFNKKHLTKVDINDAPCYKYVIDNFIPYDLEISDTERKKTYEFFSQIIAYSISPIKPREFFFGLYGNEGTGKTFFVDVIKDIIGDSFFLERSIDEMMDNRFASSDFWGSKVYVEPDMKTNSVLPEAFIKTFSGQKQITVEHKQKQPDKGVNISIAMFFVSNFDFITKGMEGLARRVIYLPFKNRIENPDTALRDKISGNEPKGKEAGKHSGRQFDERPIILGLAMQGWKSFLKNGSNFTLPKWVADAKQAWIEKSDTVRGFINEKYLRYEYNVEEQRGSLYEKYKTYCSEEADKKPYGKSKFYEEVSRMKDVRFKNKNGDRVFEFYPGKAKEGGPFSG